MTGIRVGDPVPELRRRIELPDMIAYAGATWDWHRLHYDPDFLAAAELPAPVVDGQVFGALLVEQAQDWLGPRAFVRRLEFRFANLVFAGETVRCLGEVTEVDGPVVRIAQRVEVTGDDRPAIAKASIEVELR